MQLRKYIAIGLKWWWFMLLGAVVGGAASYGVSRLQAPVYQAITKLIVGQSIQAAQLDSKDLLTSEQLALTYAEIARTRPVLQGVVETLGLSDTWQDLAERLTITPIVNTQLIQIAVEANSPEGARVTADEVVRQLIRLSPTSLQNQENEENQSFVRQRLTDLQARIEAGQASLTSLQSQMSGSLSAEQVKDLQNEINTLDGLINEWENNYTQLLVFVEGSKSPNYLAVIDPAQASPDPVRPRILLNTILGGMVGLFLALGVIVLLEYLDDTLKSSDDLNQSFGLPAVGVVAYIRGKNYQDKLVTMTDLFSPVSESYRMIRSNIQFMSVDRPAKTIMVTSAVPGEGKSVTSANLAIVMAQAGLKTVLIDADLRRPVQHHIFQVPNVGGVTDLLCSPELQINGHLRKTSVENLQLITSGPLPPNPSELLGSQRMSQVLANLREVADIIILDSPPAAAVTDASVLSTRVDGVLLVTEAGRTRRDLVKRAITNLQQSGAHLFGGIINRVSTKGGDGYYHQYQQYYAPNRAVSVKQPAAAGQQHR